MELKFLGIGSAFATDLYNTSAFFVENNKLFLIDCGETTFRQLFQQDFFKHIEEIYVVITHTHADHIASISSLIKYSSSANVKLNIVVPSTNNNGLYNDILDLLKIFNIYSIYKNKISFITSYEVKEYFKSFECIEFLPTTHTPELEGNCYSILFKTNSGNIFYSSDSIDTNYITKYLNDDLDKMYVDVTLSIPTVHLNLDTLEYLIPKEKRSKIYCMHFDSKKCMQKAKDLGFNIANSVAKDLSCLDISFMYNKYEDKLVLFLCNDIVFMQLQQHNLLQGVNKISLHIKDTDYSSIAGIGSLLCYSYFVLKRPIYIYTQNSTTNASLLRLAEIYGIPSESMEFVEIK